MTTNAFLRIRNLLPQPPVLVGRVVAHHATDDTSTIELPTGQAVVDYAAGLKTGTQFEARGQGVAVGRNAFIRAGVVESEAPDVPVSEIVIGRVVA